MEIGDNGHLLEHVVQPVEMVLILATASVTVLHLSMEEMTVLDIRMRQSHATTTA